MEYKRLTKKADVKLLDCEYSCGSLHLDVVKRLGELEDKIDNGTLIELPCKVGDKVYIATKLWDIKEVVEAEVACVEVTADEKGIRYRTYLDHEYVFSKTNPNLIKNRYIFYNDEFFLTKAEAEAKLKELQNEI